MSFAGMSDQAAPFPGGCDQWSPLRHPRPTARVDHANQVDALMDVVCPATLSSDDDQAADRAVDRCGGCGRRSSSRLSVLVRCRWRDRASGSAASAAGVLLSDAEGHVREGLAPR